MFESKPHLPDCLLHPEVPRKTVCLRTYLRNLKESCSKRGPRSFQGPHTQISLSAGIHSTPPSTVPVFSIRDDEVKEVFPPLGATKGQELATLGMTCVPTEPIGVRAYCFNGVGFRVTFWVTSAHSHPLSLLRRPPGGTMLPTPTGLISWRRGGSMSPSSLFHSSGKWPLSWLLRAWLTTPSMGLYVCPWPSRFLDDVLEVAVLSLGLVLDSSELKISQCPDHPQTD